VSRPRVLVLGAEGMLGQTIFRVLAEGGAVDVVGSARAAAGPLLAFDAERDGPRELLRAAGRVTLVVNAIAVLTAELREGGAKARERARVVNAGFPHRLCEAACEAGAHVLLVSSDAVFRPEHGICVESTAPDAKDAYGASKREGEVWAERVLNLRCSMVGPDPRRGRGLLEWVLRRPRGGAIDGYTDQRWNGVTTLQLARLCERLAEPAFFARVRAESPVHHLCPNETTTKYELVRLLAETFRPDVRVAAVASGHPITRELATELCTLRELLGSDRPLADALKELRDGRPRAYWAREGS
jgi:dTDP-4-dehydrorhamnose reductase